MVTQIFGFEMKVAQKFSESNVLNLCIPPSMQDSAIFRLQETFSLLEHDDQNQILRKVDSLKVDLRKGFVTEKLLSDLNLFVEFVSNKFNRPIDVFLKCKKVNLLKEIANDITKIKVLHEYPDDFIKLQRFSLECKRPSSTSDRESKIEASEPLHITSDEYIPCVDTIHKDKECFIGLNDSLLPMKRFLQKLLNRNIKCLEAEESLKNAYEKQLRDKSEQKYDYPYEAYEFEKRKDYHNIIPEWHIAKLFVPFARFHAIYQNTKLRENYETLERRYQPVIDQSINLAGSISLLNRAMEHYGCDCGKESRMCIVYFEKESNKVKIESVNRGELQNFNDFVNSKKFGELTTIEKMESLCERLRSAENDMKYSVSLSSKEEFFLMTGRANIILEAFERCLQDNSLEELTAMSQLRKFLNKCAFQYKIKFASETEPILGVKISKCKLIIDSPTRKLFYIEKANVARYIDDIKIHIKEKAKGFDKRADDEGFSDKELMDILETQFNKNLEDTIKEKLVIQSEYHWEAETWETYAKEFFKKSTLSRICLIGSVLRFGVDCVEWGINKIDAFLTMKSKSGSYIFSNILGLLLSGKQECQSSSCSSSNHSADKKAIEEVKEEISQSDVDRINCSFPELKLSPRYIVEFAKGCRCMIKANELRENEKKISRETQFSQTALQSLNNFFNLIRLHYVLRNADFNRIDCKGILVQERNDVIGKGEFRLVADRYKEYYIEIVN